MRIYEFVREHVMPFNAVIVMSMTVAAVLDFLAPQAPYLAWASYALAALVLLAMVLEVQALRSGATGGAWYIQLLARLRPPPGPLWKAPAWQVVAIIAAIALVLGQASRARADSGGLIASLAPNLRNVQMLLLGIKEDTQRIQTTLDGMDTKVDSIHASVGSLEAALMKEPIEYLMEGDYPFLQKLAASGKRLPRNKDALLVGLNQKRDDRLDLLRLYMGHEFDIHQPVPFDLVLIRTDDVATLKNVQKLNAWTQKHLKDFKSSGELAGHLMLRSCPTMDLLAYAYIAGDKPLADWLIQQGLKPDAVYPCEFGRTKWTVSAKEIRELLAP